MSASIHLAGPDDARVILPMLAACHDEAGFETDAEHRAAALAPLLEGSPLGCVYLVGPRNAPIGYIAFSFGWSLEFGGMDGFVDEFYIRRGVRGRGVGAEVLATLVPQLEGAGLKALHIEAPDEHPRLQRLYARAGFTACEGSHLMTRVARNRG